MKINYKKLIILFLILKVNFIFSQVTTTIDQVTINNQDVVTNCSTIDLGTTPTNNLNFLFTLNKS